MLRTVRRGSSSTLRYVKCSWERLSQGQYVCKTLLVELLKHCKGEHSVVLFSPFSAALSFFLKSASVKWWYHCSFQTLSFVVLSIHFYEVFLGGSGNYSFSGCFEWSPAFEIKKFVNYLRIEALWVSECLDTWVIAGRLLAPYVMQYLILWPQA